MTPSPDLGAWLRQQREQRSWTRNDMARQLIRAAQASGDTAMPAACDVAASIYRWERGTVNPSDRYRLYYCHVLGIPPDRFGDPGYDPAQDPPRVIITISLPEGTDARIRLASRSGRCCCSPNGSGTATSCAWPSAPSSPPP